MLPTHITHITTLGTDAEAIFATELCIDHAFRLVRHCHSLTLKGGFLFFYTFFSGFCV